MPEVMSLLTLAYFQYSRNYAFLLSDLGVKNTGFQLKNVEGVTLLFKITLMGYIRDVC